MRNVPRYKTQPDSEVQPEPAKTNNFDVVLLLLTEALAFAKLIRPHDTAIRDAVAVLAGLITYRLLPKSWVSHAFVRTAMSTLVGFAVLSCMFLSQHSLWKGLV